MSPRPPTVPPIHLPVEIKAHLAPSARRVALYVEMDLGAPPLTQEPQLCLGLVADRIVPEDEQL
jgi:hypothetical protein